MDGLGLLYSDDEVSKAIDESKKVLRKYRQLKIAKKLKMPSVKSPTFSDMPRGGSGMGDTALDKYIDVISQMQQTERCVARCELLESIILQHKYLDDTDYSQWQLADKTGYSVRQYHNYLNRAYLQFATADEKKIRKGRPIGLPFLIFFSSKVKITSKHKESNNSPLTD